MKRLSEISLIVRYLDLRNYTEYLMVSACLNIRSKLRSIVRIVPYISNVLTNDKLHELALHMSIKSTVYLLLLEYSLG